MKYFIHLHVAAQCPSGMQYIECGSSCKSTCDALHFGGECTEHCVEGCHCPKGTIYDESTDSCVSIESCGCMKDDKYYVNGALVFEDCNTW